MDRKWMELRRRRVPQTLAAYGGVCLAVWGAFEFVSGVFAIPEWVLRFIVIVSILGSAPVAAAAWVLRVESENRVRHVWASVSLLLLAGAGVAAGSLALALDSRPVAPSHVASSGVLVLPFENLTGDAGFDFLGVAASDWITQGITRAGIAGAVPTTTALAVARWLRGEDATGSRLDPVAAAAEETDAAWILTGTYIRDRDSLRFTAQVSDPIGGVLVSLDPVTAELEGPSSGLETLRERTTAALAVLLDERMAPTAGDQTIPTLEAYRHFQEGIELYMRLASREALPHFQAAYEADTTFVEALYYVALQLVNINEPVLADSVFRLTDLRRSRLTPYYRYLVDAGRAFVRRDWDAARRASRSAAILAPASKAYYDWGFFSILAGRPEEAIEAFAYLKPGRGAMRGWTSLTWMMADAHHWLEQYDAALDAAELTYDLFPDRPVTNAMQLGRELAALGRVAEVQALVGDLKGHVGSNETMGLDQRASIPNTLYFIALELRVHGFPDEANDLFLAAAEAITRPAGQGANSAEDELLLGRVLFEAGHDEEALEVIEDLLDREPGSPELRGRRGVLLARLGWTEGARQELAALSATGGPEAHEWAAAIAVSLDEKDRALDELEASLAAGASRWLWLHANTLFDALRADERFDKLAAPRG